VLVLKRIKDVFKKLVSTHGLTSSFDAFEVPPSFCERKQAIVEDRKMNNKGIVEVPPITTS